MDLNRQLQKDLPKLVIGLNNKRGFLERARGKRYEYKFFGEDEFLICVSDRKIRKKKELPSTIANIRISNGGLDGYISFNERHSAASSNVRDYIHSLSHIYDLPSGNLLSPDYLFS